MIALDTNVLLRFLLGDDAGQASTAQELVAESIARSERVLITDPVLCELDWVLRASYRMTRDPRVAVFRALLDDSAFEFESRDRFVAALATTQAGRADLSDHLIGLRGRDFGVTTTYSFDRHLRRDPRFTVL